MRFLSAAHTDVGTSKKVNQDAFCLKIAKTPNANIAFAVLCDGMGGLKCGELASALVVNAFARWFENEFPITLKTGVDFNAIKAKWSEIVLDQGQKILEYGQSEGMSLGTTLTAILIVNDKYIYVQVGDSRIYQMSHQITQITKDQTLVSHEVEQHRLTEAEAMVDKRKNILLQCVGASKTIVPDIQTGTLTEGQVFLLCSDGFRHEISSEEIFGVMAPSLLSSEKMIKKCLVDLIELNKSRNEKDNITAIAIKAIK